MHILRPNQVSFGSSTWADIERVAIDRVTTRAAREWSDEGPFLVFADAPEQLVRARVTQRLDRTTLSSPLPGEKAELRVELGATDAHRRLVRFQAVVESVTHDIAGARALRSITLLAVSYDGHDDPVTVSDAP